MNDIPRQTLKQIVQQYGPEIASDPRRCEGLLRDLCGEHRREIFVLISALEEDVVGGLRSLTAQLPFSVVLPRLAAELRETTALTEDAARWAVAVWAEALDLASEADTRTVLQTSNNGLKPQSVNAVVAGSGGAEMGFRLARRWQAHGGEIGGLAFSPDGRQLVSAGMDADAHIWRVASAEEQSALKQQTGILTSAAWHPDGLTVALGSSDTGLYLWHWTDPGTLVPRLRGHQGGVTGLAFTPNNGLLISSSQDGTLGLWDTSAGTLAARLHGHTDGVLDVAASPDGRTLVSAGGWDKTVRLWDIGQRQELWALSGHTAAVTSVAFAPDGGLIASASWDETIRLWNPSRGQANGVLTGLVHAGEAAGEHESPTVLFSSVALAPDRETLAAGDWRGAIQIWHVHRRAPLAVLREHTARVRRVCFSPGGRWLASADDQGILCLWRRNQAAT